MLAREIRTHSQKFFQTDASLCDFLGNLSELFYYMNDSKNALEALEEARKYTWRRLTSYGLVVD